MVDRKAIHWLARQPTPYNDFLFTGLAKEKYLDLTVHYREQLLESHPWKTAFCKNYSAKYYSCFLGIDWRIISLALQRKAPFFVVAGWDHLTSVVLLCVLMLLGKSYAIWTDTPNLNKKRNPIFGFLRSSWLKLVLNCADSVMGTGVLAVQALKLMGAPENKLKVFPVWVDLERIDAVKKTCRLPAANDKLLFISSGVLKNSLKGHDIAIRSLALAAQRSAINFEYFIAGRGEDLESLRFLATELGVDSRVRFLGWLEPEQVIDLLARCDVLIHPSPTHEPYGVAVIEAMAAGCVVLASDVTCAAIDRIQNGENGFIHPAGSVERLAEQIEWLYVNREKLFSIKSRARATAHEWPVDRGVSIIKQMVA